MLEERWLPEGFEIPVVESARWELRPLSMDLLAQDFHAYMSSVDHLRNGGMLQPPGAPWIDWPRRDITVRWALAALGEAEFAMAYGYRVEYAILAPDQSESFGCVYVFPSSKADFDAEVTMWTRADVVNEYDAEVYDFIRTWLPKQYPFFRIAWPGREIPWDEWEALP
jgi:hypothetical protein